MPCLPAENGPGWLNLQYPYYPATVRLGSLAGTGAHISTMKECNQCGKCCIHYSDGGLSATAEEIESWEIFNPAIAQYVVDGKIWMDPSSGEQLTCCPWLEVLPTSPGAGSIKYGCRIYHDRPEDCRHYPVSIAEMVRDGCEMIELRDLDAPKQAQTALDQLMADSRPPLS
jgi:Fe-S-cluster containining protein